MTADEIRRVFNMAPFLKKLSEERVVVGEHPITDERAVSLSLIQMVAAVGEVAAQLAELNQHLALIASVVRPEIDARAARVRVDAKVSEG